MRVHEVRIELADGTALVNWPEVDITLDMLSPGNPWTISLWYSEENDGAWKSVRRRALLEQGVQIFVDGALQLRGRIESAETNADRDGAVYTISGRDVAARALDWDADPTIALRGVTLEAALERLFGDVGLRPEITDAARAREIQSAPHRSRGTRAARRTNRVDDLKIQAGERIWQVAEKLCRKLGYLMWIAPSTSPNAVGVVIDKPNESSDVSFALERRAVGQVYEGNILRSRRKLSSMNVPTQVTGFVRSSLRADRDNADRIAIVNEFLRTREYVIDERPLGLPPKPRYIKPERARTSAAVERECQKVIAEANANLEAYEITVRGFGQNEKLYAINTIARIRDDLELPRLDGLYLCTRVHLHQSRQRGQVSDLRLVPRGAIQVFPEAA